jgi:hypothetical protein
MIADWTPARTDLASGIVIKQTTLERNKYPVPQPNITSSIAWVGSGSTNIPYQTENILVTGSSIQMYTITGSSGGSITDTETLVYSTSSFDLTTGNSITFNLSSSGAERVSCYISSSAEGAFNAAITLLNQGTTVYFNSDPKLNYTLNETFNISSGYLTILNNSDAGTLTISGLEVYQEPSYYQTVETVYGLNQILIPNEFDFNGELQGSEILVTDGSLNGGNPFLTFPTQEYRYDIVISSSDATALNTWLNAPIITGELHGFYLVADEPGFPYGLTYAKISKTSLNSLDATPTLEDLQNFRIDILSPIGIYETHTIVGVQEQSTYYIFTLIIDSSVYTIGTYSNRLVVFSPVDSAIFVNSNYDVLVNNADAARFNDEFFDVDFSSNSITAVNRVNIISASRGTGSATPSTTPSSNYTTARIANPRYNGCKNTSPDFNIIDNQQLPSVEKYTSYFIYTPGGLGNTLAERSGSGNYKIGFLVDELGNVIQPTANNTGSAYVPNLLDAFRADTTVVLSPNNTQTIDQTEYTVYKPAVVSNIIMYSDTGSLGNDYLVSGSYSSINFHIDPNIKFNYNLSTVKSGSASVQTISSGISATASFNLVIQDAAQSWTSSINAYKPPYTSLIRNLMYSSLALDAPGTGGVTMSIMDGNTALVTSSAAGPNSTMNLTALTIQYFNTSSLYWVKITNNTNNNLTVKVATSPVVSGLFISSQTSSIQANTPYWYTSSNAPLVLSSSVDIGKAYQYYAQVPVTSSGTPLTSSGFDNPQPLNILPYDEIRFEGNEATVATIVSSSFDNSNPLSPVLYLHLQAPFAFDSVDIQYFALRRWVSSIDNLIINSPGTVMGSGFIFPKYPSPLLKANLPSIIENLTNKNLI